MKDGFNDEVDTEYPNVIFTGNYYPEESSSDFHWPTTVEEAAKFWVVVIDYHW